MQGFKVVYVAPDGRLLSFGAPFGVISLGIVDYIPGLATGPNPDTGELAVFQTEDDAIRFLSSTGVGPFYHMRISDFEVMDYGERHGDKHQHYRLFHCDYEPVEEGSLWETRREDGTPLRVLNPLPTGTALASSVTIGEEVDLSRFVVPGSTPIRLPYFRKE